MPRKYRKRDKRAEAAARPRPHSKDWPARRAKIIALYGVKLPERTPIQADDKAAYMLSRIDEAITYSSTINYSETEPE